jgi:type IX secretion system PorP/SprF family membrane protein
MLKKALSILSLTITLASYAQQYPWWTQYRGQQYMLNPGFCGTKRLVDIRLNYRNQWVGYDGAPKTYALSLNSRLWKGRLGVGGFMFQDNIGPFRNTVSALTFAYHIKFADTELSFGVQGNYLKQKFIGTDVTLRNQQDKAINQYITDQAGSFDGSFGIVYYNDRFHLALGANNIAGAQLEHYKKDSLHSGKYTNTAHYNFSAGYNWAENPDFVFENSLMAVYTAGMPPLIDYTLRLHIKKQLMTGLSLRFKDAIALQLGYTIMDQFQIVYSYDFVTSPLRRYQSGTHEAKFVWSTNLGTDKK